MSTPESSLEELRPALTEVMRRMRAASLDAQGHFDLASLVATHFFGVACAAYMEAEGEDGMPTRDLVETVADAIVEPLRAQAPLEAARQ